MLKRLALVALLSCPGLASAQTYNLRNILPKKPVVVSSGPQAKAKCGALTAGKLYPTSGNIYIGKTTDLATATSMCAAKAASTGAGTCSWSMVTNQPAYSSEYGWVYWSPVIMDRPAGTLNTVYSSTCG